MLKSFVNLFEAIKKIKIKKNSSTTHSKVCTFSSPSSWVGRSRVWLSSAQRRCGQCRNYTRAALGRAQLSQRAGGHLTSSELPTDLICSPAWLVDTRKSSLSRKTPRSRQRSRNPKATTRRPRRKRRWCSHVVSAGHKCQIPRPSSSILRASTPRALFPQSWRAWRHERPRQQRLIV